MTRELICIGCPMGCRLTAEIEDGVVTRVTGNTCRRGEEYAKKECVAPMRTATVPVRTNGEVPKAQVLAVADALRRATAQAPIHAGDVVLRDVCGTGVDVIAVKSM